MRFAAPAGIFRPPGLPHDCYMYHIVQRKSNISPGGLAAICSDNTLRSFHVNHDSQNNPLTQLSCNYNIHGEKGVTCLETVGTAPDLLVTAGRDGTIKLWDTRQMPEARPVSTFLAPSDTLQSSNNGGPKAYISLACNGQSILAGAEYADNESFLALWDVRSRGSPLCQYTEYHNDDITVLAFHPTRSSIILSGSTDGLLNVIDVDITNEDDAVLQIVNHGSSLHRGAFLDNDTFYGLSHDEIFSIYPMESADETVENVRKPEVFGDIRRRLNASYAIDVIQAPGSQPCLAVGSHTESAQYIDILPMTLGLADLFSEESAIRLPGAHADEIVRSIAIRNENRNQNQIFTAGEDGCIKTWGVSEPALQDNGQDLMHEEMHTAAGRNDTDQNAISSDSGNKMTMKQKKVHAKSSARFQPY